MSVFSPTVVAPMAKTMTSVSDVTVMATPACLIASPILSSTDIDAEEEESRLSRHCTITNMSSIPMPGKKIMTLIIVYRDVGDVNSAVYFTEKKIKHRPAYTFIMMLTQ